MSELIKRDAVIAALEKEIRICDALILATAATDAWERHTARQSAFRMAQRVVKAIEGETITATALLDGLIDTLDVSSWYEENRPLVRAGAEALRDAVVAQLGADTGEGTE